jgi:hypothetical protein
MHNLKILLNKLLKQLFISHTLHLYNSLRKLMEISLQAKYVNVMFRKGHVPMWLLLLDTFLT